MRKHGVEISINPFRHEQNPSRLCAGGDSFLQYGSVGRREGSRKRIKDLFQKCKSVKLALSGHVHYVDAIEYLGVKYLCNGAVSGNWWRNPLALDEFAPVYAIIDLYD